MLFSKVQRILTSCSWMYLLLATTSSISCATYNEIFGFDKPMEFYDEIEERLKSGNLSPQEAQSRLLESEGELLKEWVLNSQFHCEKKPRCANLLIRARKEESRIRAEETVKSEKRAAEEAERVAKAQKDEEVKREEAQKDEMARLEVEQKRLELERFQAETALKLAEAERLKIEAEQEKVRTELARKAKAEAEIRKHQASLPRNLQEYFWPKRAKQAIHYAQASEGVQQYDYTIEPNKMVVKSQEFYGAKPIGDSHVVSYRVTGAGIERRALDEEGVITIPLALRHGDTTKFIGEDLWTVRFEALTLKIKSGYSMVDGHEKGAETKKYDCASFSSDMNFMGRTVTIQHWFCKGLGYAKMRAASTNGVTEFKIGTIIWDDSAGEAH